MKRKILGRRVFQQRCAICHTEIDAWGAEIRPVLSKELVEGNEDTISPIFYFEWVKREDAGISSMVWKRRKINADCLNI